MIRCIADSFNVRGDAIDRLAATHPALDEQLRIRRARLVSAEAELERVLEVIDVEIRSAAGVRTVQKRAVLNAVGHRCVTPLTHLVIGQAAALSEAKCDGLRRQVWASSSRVGAVAIRGM
jgi:hypothetical protein